MAALDDKKAADAQRKRDARAKVKTAAEKAAAEKAAAEKAAAEKAAAMKERAEKRAAVDKEEREAFEPPTPEEAGAFRAWCVRSQITPPGPRQARQLFMQWKKTHGTAREMSDEDAVAEVKRWTVIHSCRYYDRAGKRHRALAGETIADIEPKTAASYRRLGHIEPYQEPSKLGLNPVAVEQEYDPSTSPFRKLSQPAVTTG